MTVLGPRALNRALLARQGLLRREAAPVPDVLERLVGLQAQVPWNPYVGLWARLEAFEPEALSRLVAQGAAVRTGVMRATLHVLTLRDAQRIRPLLQPVVRGRSLTAFRRQLAGSDVDAIAAAGLELVRERPRTRKELGRLLGERWPDAQADAVAFAAIFANTLLQVPPRGEWGGVLQATWAPIPGPLDAGYPPDDLVLRYLRAFGPATVGDLRTWSGLTGLRAVVERLRPRLRTLRDEAGRELLDVPDGLLPDADTPAPPRLLPEFDNAFLSHEYRGRIVAGPDPLRDLPPGGFRGCVLVDGFVAGHWSCDGGAVTLHGVEPDDALAAEADALGALLRSQPRLTGRRGP